MDISLKTLCITCGVYVAVVIVVLLYAHFKAAQSSADLALRIDDAEKRQTAALGEWSSAMSKHISDSIKALGQTTEALQARSEALNSAALSKYEATSKASSDVFETSARETTAKHEAAMRIISEQQSKLLRELAERQEAANKALAKQYDEAIEKIAESVKALNDRIAKSDQTNRELNSALQDLKKTLEEAVKL